jgi:hypothetical protein
MIDNNHTFKEVVKRKTKKPVKIQIAHSPAYSIVSENIDKTKKHAQYSVVSEKITQNEMKKPTPKKRTKDI